MLLDAYGDSDDEEDEESEGDWDRKRSKDIDFMLGWLGGDERIILLRGGQPGPSSPLSPPLSRSHPNTYV